MLCRGGGGEWHVRIGERHQGVIRTFDQPLLNRYAVVRNGLRSVDMELYRF
jgi:hypothetical protein